MPLIDALNHHPRGAGYQLDDDTMFTTIVRPGSDLQCYARYGDRRDRLRQALHYGYVDREAPFAISAPVTVEVPGVGQVAVGPVLRRRQHPLDPPLVTRDVDGTLWLSHVVFDQGHPDRVRSVLTLAAKSAAAQNGASPHVRARAGDRLVESLVRANLELLDNIQREASVADGPAATMIAEATAAQAQIVAGFDA